MRVFVAGATGAIGRQLVPRLVAAGHEVHGMTRSASKQAMLDELGAVPVVADALDPDQVAEAVARARPDVIVHQLTAIAAVDMRHLERDFALTNRLRTEGTDHLLSAGQAVGVRRFVAQKRCPYARSGGPSRPRRTRSTPRPRARCARTSRRSATSRRRSSAPGGRKGSCCATARSTGPAHRWRRARSRRAGPQAQVPAGRRRRRRVVVHPRRRRGGRDGRGGRARQPRRLQRRRR